MISVCLSLLFSLWIVIFALEMMMIVVVVVVVIIIDQTWHWNNYIFHVYEIYCYLTNCEFLMFRNSTFAVFTLWSFCLSDSELKIRQHLNHQRFFTVVKLIEQLVINHSEYLLHSGWFIYVIVKDLEKLIFTLWIPSHLASCTFSHWFNSADPLIGWKLNLDSRGNLVHEHHVNNLETKFTQMKSAWNQSISLLARNSFLIMSTNVFSCDKTFHDALRFLFRCRIRKLVIHCLRHMTGNFFLPDLSSDASKFALSHPPSLVRWAKIRSQMTDWRMWETEV